MQRGSAAGRSARVGTPFHDLTPRRIEVLIAFGLGSSSQEMAKKLGLSLKTIYKHRSQLMRKLGLRNEAQVARFAIANGFTTAGDDSPASRTHADPG
jgi:DNA-binding NarL/FixJ family response regulator